MSSLEGISAAEIAEELKAVGAESRTEEDFKIRAEYILRVKAFEKMGINLDVMSIIRLFQAPGLMHFMAML